MKIKIAVMGCAAIAERSVIPAILELSECFELIGVASREEAKAKDFASKFNCEAIVGYDTLLQRDDIDAIYMPLPTGLHKEWIIKCLQAGKHVYAEKSIAMSYQESCDFVEEAKKNNLTLMEGYMFLYHSQHQQVLKMIQQGEIGEIRHFSASFGFPPFPPGNFRYDLTVGGGALMDSAGYVVRATSLILQQELKVKASCIHFDEKQSSLYGSAFLVSDQNIPATISYGFDNFYQCKYEIWGSKGKLIASKAFTPKAKESPIIILEKETGARQIVCDSDNHFKNAMQTFAQSIQTGETAKHYSEILTQSFLLESLLQKSKEC